MEPFAILLAAGAGMVGGAMNALAGGGTFATLPALIALGLPAPIANATSNVALLPGAAASAWTYRDELHPVAGIAVRLLAAITFVAGLAGSALLVLTPTETFDVIIPWLLLFAFAVMMFGKRAADWLHARVTIGRPALLATQSLLGVYGGYFGGGVGLITTAVGGARLDAAGHRCDDAGVLRASLRVVSSAKPRSRPRSAATSHPGRMSRALRSRPKGCPSPPLRQARRFRSPARSRVS